MKSTMINIDRVYRYKFPRLVTYSDDENVLVVLVTEQNESSFTGTLVYDRNDPSRVGLFSKTWRVGESRFYEGEVVLTNDIN